jgi:hypothetical protein
MGYESTWDEYHLDQMIANFHHLKTSGVFPNVPVRADHSMSIQSVVGYITKLYRDLTDPSFLAADMEITEPDAMERWERKTYRARSLEVGPYETNDGAIYYPTVFGLAFVDIPAVEGLYASHNRSNHTTQVMTDQEDSTVSHATDPAPAPAPTPDPTPDPAPTPDPTPDPAPTPDSTPDPAPTPDPADHSASGRPVALFTVNGQPTQDFGAVQAHITELEKFRAESISDARKRAVHQWAKDGKIAQPQVDSMVAVALTMTPAQFDAFASSYNAAPGLALLGKHTHDGPPSNQAPDTGEGDDEFGLVLETIRNHQRGGMTADKIRKTPQFSKFTAMCAARGVKVEDHITL